MNLIKLDDHSKTCNSTMQETSNLKSPIETIKRTTQIEILESFLSEQAIAQYPQSNGSVPSFFV